VEVGDLLAMFVAHDVAQPPVVHPLRAIFRVPDDLVDEVAEMQHESEPICRSCMLVLDDHAPVRVLRTLIGVLAAHERKFHWSRVTLGGRGQRAPHAAP